LTVVAESAGANAAATAASRWVSITAGHNHDCGVKTDGTAWCWGFNERGQLGDGVTDASTLPVKVPSGQAWLAISAGHDATCGIKADHSLWCWGWNIYGEVGDGTTIDRHSPIRIGGGKNWTTISSGTNLSTCGLRADQTAWCWGRQLLSGTTNSAVSKPARVPGGQWLTITAGSLMCGVKTTHAAYCWNSGLVGDGTQAIRYEPTRVFGLGNWVTISASPGFTCGLTLTAHVKCWGERVFNAIGDGPPDSFPSLYALVPEIVGGGTITDLSTGDYYSCTIRASHTMWCWGWSDANQHLYTPERFGTASDWAAVTNGGGAPWDEPINHVCALKLDHTAWCWGPMVSDSGVQDIGAANPTEIS
jgi:alpha-tubulin suppressor-like RCC1 family protein